MNTQALLSGKFSAAKLPEICAPRRELLNLFHKAAENAVIFVFAPAGYGKTVSTQLWLEAMGRNSVWLALDGYDNAPAVFYRLLCTGLLSTQPDNEAMAAVAESPVFSSSPAEHAVRMVSEMKPCPPCALVFDDMHLITNEEIRKSLPFVIRRLPAAFVTIFLARTQSGCTFETDGISAGYITAKQLAFSQEETGKYLNACGKAITDDELAAVHEYTEGWPIGVSAIAKSGQLEIGSRGAMLLDEYIKEQIWSKWSPELQDFLLDTCIVDEIDAGLADSLTGRTDSAEMLETIMRTNSFVSRTNDGVYRCHHLFLDFLRRSFTASSQEKRRVLLRTAGDYYVKRGMTAKALLCYTQSGFVEPLISLFDRLNEYSANSCSVAEFLELLNAMDFDALAEKVSTVRPFLLLRCAWKYYAQGDAPKMFYYFDRFADQAAQMGSAAESGMFHALLMVFIDHRKSLREHMLALADRDIPQTAGTLRSLLTATINLPFWIRSHRDYSEFATDLEGMLKLFESSCDKVLDGLYPVLEAQIKAEIYCEQNKLKNALACAQSATAQADEAGMGELVFSARMISATVLLAMGSHEKAKNEIARLDSYVKANSLEFLRPNFFAFQTRLRIEEGDAQAAKEWFDNYFVTETENLALYRIYQHFTTARAYIALGQSKAAESYLLRLKKLGEDFARPMDIAETEVLISIVEWAMGKRRESVDTMTRALEIMQPYGFIRIIADEGTAVLPILKKLVLKNERSAETCTISSTYLNEIALAAYEQSKRRKGLGEFLYTRTVRLSKQQKMVLTLLSQGYKNAEIVKLTGLTIYTVKAHASAAYAKLGVNNAMDAVLKAQKLGLID